ncbi:MAG: hypothetical protein AB1716_04395, partial [Planctomycetota bacterium]
GRRGRPPRAAALGPVGFDARAWRDQLIAQQGRIDAQLAAVSRLLQTLGAPASGRAPAGRPGGPGRRGRAGSLKTFIERALRSAGKPMRVVEITAAVQRAGYPTRNKTLAKSVGNALTDMPGVEKVDRGVFRAK